MMRLLIPALAIGGLLGPASTAQVPAGDLAQILPSGTMVFFQVDQLEKLALLDPDGAIMTLVEHDAAQAAFEGLYEFFDEFDDEEFLLALDLEPDELGRLFNGRIMFAVPEFVLAESEIEVGSTSRIELDLELGRGMVMMADFGGTEERLEGLLENLAKLREEQDDVHMAAVFSYEEEGARLFNLEEVSVDREVDDSRWMALVDEMLIFADEEDTLLDFVDLAQNGAPEGDRLADDPRYLETLDRAGEHDALLYFNLGALMPLINELIEFQLEKQGMAVAMFLRIEDLIAAMRLDALESLFASVRVEDDEAGLVFGMTHADTEYGLHNLLTYGDSGVELPAYFSSDFHSASISSFDFSAAYEIFDKLLLKASPRGHVMFDGQLASLENEGFALRDALLHNLDSQVVEVLGYPEATVAGPEDYPTQAYVIRVKDPRSLEEALATLGDDTGEDEPVEFMNETIRVMPLPFGLGPGQGAGHLAFAIVGNELVASIGETKMVENLIAHIKNPGASLLDDDDLMDAFDALPSEDVVALGFVNVADILSNLIRGSDGALGAQIRLARDPDDLEQLLEAQELLDELPDVSDIHYSIVSKTFKTDDAFIQRMLLRPNLDP